jgi:hypothetical protein
MINSKINHRIKAFISLVFVLIVINPSPSQTQEWIVFTNGKYIGALLTKVNIFGLEQWVVGLLS